MNLLNILLSLFFVCIFQSTLGQEEVGLCSQVYQMHQYCSNVQSHISGISQITKHGRIGKSGPRGPPGKPGIVNYDAINLTISKQFEDLENELNTKLAENSPALETTIQNREDIQYLKTELQELTAKLRNIEELMTWYRASDNLYYKLFHDKVNYETAKQNCRNLGAKLASSGVRDSTVRRQLVSLIRPHGNDVWIGLDDIQQEGRFVWADGVVSTTSNTDWYRNQPDNAGNNEDCGHFSPGYGWKINDVHCTALMKFVCVKSI